MDCPSKTTLNTSEPPPPPPLHSEHPIDPSTPPSVKTITHLALLLHAAKAEYSYWGNRVSLLSKLLTNHKEHVIAEQEEQYKEDWERQCELDAEAQLFREADRDAELEVEQQLMLEAEQRAEADAERQLLVEAGVVDEEDESWRRVGLTGKSVKKRRSLVRPKDVKALAAGRDGLGADLSTVMEVTEVAPPAVEEVEYTEPTPPKTEEEVFVEERGKARWTRRRSLRRDRRTMNDLRGSSKLQEHEDDASHLEPRRRQSLPSMHQTRPAEEKLEMQEPLLPLVSLSPPPPQQDSFRPPPAKLEPQPLPQSYLPVPKRQPIPAYTSRLSRRASSRVIGARNSTPTLNPHPHPHLSEPFEEIPHHEHEAPPPHKQPTPPPPYRKTDTRARTHTHTHPAPTPQKKLSALQLAQALMLNLDTPARRYMPQYSPPFPYSSPPALSPPSSHSSPTSTGDDDDGVATPLWEVHNDNDNDNDNENKQPQPKSRSVAGAGGYYAHDHDHDHDHDQENSYGYGYEVEPAAAAAQKQKEESGNVNVSARKPTKRYGVARIYERKSRQYVRDEKGGWRAV